MHSIIGDSTIKVTRRAWCEANRPPVSLGLRRDPGLGVARSRSMPWHRLHRRRHKPHPSPIPIANAFEIAACLIAIALSRRPLLPFCRKVRFGTFQRNRVVPHSVGPTRPSVPEAKTP